MGLALSSGFVVGKVNSDAAMSTSLWRHRIVRTIKYHRVIVGTVKKKVVADCPECTSGTSHYITKYESAIRMSSRFFKDMSYIKYQFLIDNEYFNYGFGWCFFRSINIRRMHRVSWPAS